jgi:MFS family permease
MARAVPIEHHDPRRADSSSPSHSAHHEKGARTTRALSKEDRRLALLLGAPSLALALCLATLSTYLPVLAHDFTSSTAMIGLLVGGEGLVAVLLPILVGRRSDRTRTRLGPRLPFLIATAPVAAVAIGLLPFAPSLAVMAVEVFVFYLAYFTYFSPYRALYPDLVSEEAAGRAQGLQGVFNGVGLGGALVGGGFLLQLWRPLPYLVAGAALIIATAIVTVGLGKRAAQRNGEGTGSASPFADLLALVRGDGAIVRFVIGNALLTLGLSGLKSFVVLWLTQGLGKSMTFTGAAMGVVAVGTVAGALISGKLGDRYGAGRVLTISLVIFGAGLAVGTFTTNVAVLGVAFPFIALAGGAAVALPYAFLLELTSSDKHGIVAGLFDASSGVGTLLGPTLTGLAIDFLGRLFPASHGYSAMWPVLSVSVLGGTIALWGVRDRGGEAGVTPSTASARGDSNRTRSLVARPT